MSFILPDSLFNRFANISLLVSVCVLLEPGGVPFLFNLRFRIFSSGFNGCLKFEPLSCTDCSRLLFKLFLLIMFRTSLATSSFGDFFVKTVHKYKLCNLVLFYTLCIVIINIALPEPEGLEFLGTFTGNTYPSEFDLAFNKKPSPLKSASAFCNNSSSKNSGSPSESYGLDGATKQLYKH